MILIEIDTRANNYPFQCFLCFLMSKLHSSFLLITNKSQELYFELNFSNNRKMYLTRKLLPQFRFKARFYSQTLGKWSWHSDVNRKLAALLSYSLRSLREPPVQQKQFFYLVFNQYSPTIFFISVNHNFNSFCN